MSSSNSSFIQFNNFFTIEKSVMLEKEIIINTSNNSLFDYTQNLNLETIIKFSEKCKNNTNLEIFEKLMNHLNVKLQLQSKKRPKDLLPCSNRHDMRGCK